MWFDVRAKLAEIEGQAPATSATTATQAPTALSVSQVSQLSQPPEAQKPAFRVASVASVATPRSPETRFPCRKCSKCRNAPATEITTRAPDTGRWAGTRRGRISRPAAPSRACNLWHDGGCAGLGCNAGLACRSQAARGWAGGVS